MSWIRSRLTYANVMATVAVFLALGGGAYAVSLKRNSVGPKQLRTDAVTGIDAKESTFDEVPSAANATNATNAVNAANAASAENAMNALFLDGLGSSSFQRRGYRVEDTETTTPNVGGIMLLDFNYSSNTVLTDLTGGFIGQMVVLSTTNANVDINDEGNFELSVFWTPDANDTLTLIRRPSGWLEVGRSDNS
jgi:hypothetical protein